MAPAGSATTNSAGLYAFRVAQPGDYWVAVDSRTIGGGGEAWAEQTFGPSGALCITGATASTLPSSPSRRAASASTRSGGPNRPCRRLEPSAIR